MTKAIMTPLGAAVSVLVLCAATTGQAACIENPTDTYVCDSSSVQTGGLSNNNDAVSVTIETGATVENNDGGTNGGDALRIRGAGDRVVNDGTITAAGDALDGGSGLSVFNSGVIDVQGRFVNADNMDDVYVENSGTVTSANDGIRLGSGQSATLINAGSITAGDEGLEAGNDAYVENTGGALISAAEDGVQVGDDALIFNGGRIESTVVGLGGDGIDIDSGTIFNTGTIAAIDGSGIDFDASTVAESFIINQGVIEGKIGIEVETGTGGPANTVSQIVISSGVIRGTQGTAMVLGAGDDVVLLFDDLTGLGTDADFPVDPALATSVFGVTDLGDGTDTLGIGSFDGGMFYDGYLDDLFDGGTDTDTASFGAGLDEFAGATLVGQILGMNFSDGVSSRKFSLTNFEWFTFGDSGKRYSVAQVLAGPVPVPLPAGVLLLGGALAALCGTRRRKA